MKRWWYVMLWCSAAVQAEIWRDPTQPAWYQAKQEQERLAVLQQEQAEREAELAAQDRKASLHTPLTVQLVLVGPERKWAVVNGTLVHEGSHIEGFHLDQITERALHFSSELGTRVERFPHDFLHKQASQKGTTP